MANAAHWIRRLLKAFFYAFFFASFCVAAVVTAAVIYSLFVRNLFPHNPTFGEMLTVCGLIAMYWCVLNDAYRRFKSWEL